MASDPPSIVPFDIPFFAPDGDAYLPTEASLGPWGPKSLNGRVVSGLLAHEIERRHGEAAYLPARLTVDMYRLSRYAPVTIRTRCLRDSHRLRVVEAEYFSEGESIAMAHCQLVRTGANLEGNVWSAPPWEAPSPDALAPPPGAPPPVRGLWDVRQTTGAITNFVQRGAWTRELRDFVGGQPLTPFVRCALVADYASPLANYSDVGLKYINSDVTLYLHRQPVGEWIGAQVVNRHATAGVAVSACWLYDQQGSIGVVNNAALAQQR